MASLNTRGEPMVDRFHYIAPKIEVVSIGAGEWVDRRRRSGDVPALGRPRSAGARPGPVCYGKGGTEATLTDVMLLIGYMDPASSLAARSR